MDYAYNLAHTWIILIRTLWGGILILHDLRHSSTLQPVSYCIVFDSLSMTIDGYISFQKVTKFTTNLNTDWVLMLE